MKIYCVRMFDNEIDIIVGYATTEEKAKKMIDILMAKDEFKDYEYEYYYAFTDTLEIDDDIVQV